MGLFGNKKSKDNNVINNNGNTNISNNNGMVQGVGFQYDSNSTVLGPQPTIQPTVNQSSIQSNIQSNIQSVSSPIDLLDQQIIQQQNIIQSQQQGVTTQAVSSIPSVSTHQVQQLVQPVEQLEVLDTSPVASTTNLSQPSALDNSTNSVPVNPVAPQGVITNYSDVEIKPKDMIPLIINSVLKPGTTMENEGNKYRDNMVSLKITLFITGIALVVRLITATIAGCFSTSFNPITGMTNTSFNPANIANVNWLGAIIFSIMLSGIFILIISGVYYFSSFIKSKGITFGRYLMVANIAFIPFVIGVTVLGPLGTIISMFVSFVLVGVSFIYSFISFISGVNNLLAIDSVNKNIIYNAINIGAIFVVLLSIGYHFFYADIINTISMIH